MKKHSVLIFTILSGFIILTLLALRLDTARLKSNLSIFAPAYKLNGDNVLILYKADDFLSKNIAEYYAQRRHTPSSQIIEIVLPENNNKISPQQFNQIRDDIADKLDEKIKIILLTWHAPYRVGCMSITSAFALGFDEKYCSHRDDDYSNQCGQTANSPFFDSNHDFLWQQQDYRLSMMLSAENLEQAKQLIDRGIAADHSHPRGTGYLVRTHEKNRSTRWQNFYLFTSLWQKNKNIDFQYVDDSHHPGKVTVRNKKDVMFYFTGLKEVPDMNTNHYLPGAIADHLTSFGGQGISRQGQMKAFRWLEAGVTGSYDTVVEPCNYPQKFPNAQILIPNYMAGDTLIEAYWKSVQQPGEGLFIGEPLARPWNAEN